MSRLIFVGQTGEGFQKEIKHYKLEDNIDFIDHPVREELEKAGVDLSLYDITAHINIALTKKYDTKDT